VICPTAPVRRPGDALLLITGKASSDLPSHALVDHSWPSFLVTVCIRLPPGTGRMCGSRMSRSRSAERAFLAGFEPSDSGAIVLNRGVHDDPTTEEGSSWIVVLSSVHLMASMPRSMRSAMVGAIPSGSTSVVHSKRVRPWSSCTRTDTLW
jgi:hypothetical protein